MPAEPPREALPEARRNSLLRRVDWRFALPDAELVERRRLPRIGGVGRARRRAAAAGFEQVRVYWPGPLPQRPPQFWLPVDSPEAVEHLLARRPPRSLAGVALRWLWRLAWRAGLLAPLYVVGQRGGGGPTAGGLPPAGASLLLLTGGHRSINKVVGLAIGEGGPGPTTVVKFARVPEAEAGIEREAEVLSALAEERSELAGIPRLRGRGRRAGLAAVAESPIEGDSLLSALTPASFGELAERVTRFLLDLAGEGSPRPPAEWWPRLVGKPLDELEGRFGRVLGAGAVARARELLEGLGKLPIVCEHRDCAPWNVVLTGSGAPALLDWESAEPRGLPGLDLVYFLANSAFVLEGALESGRTREAYARLLDPSTAQGRVAASCVEEYTAALGIDAAQLRRLRLLCWIVHCRSEYRHQEMAAAGAPAPKALRGGVFLGLVEEELR